MNKDSDQGGGGQNPIESFLAELRRLNNLVELNTGSMRDQQKKISTLESQLRAIRGSNSYKMGRMLARAVSPIRRTRRSETIATVATPKLIESAPTRSELAISPSDAAEPQAVRTLLPPEAAMPAGVSPLEALDSVYAVSPGTEVVLKLSSQCYSGGARSGLVQISFSDQDDQAVVPSGLGSAHPKLGEYRYLPDALTGPEEASFDIQVPPRATQLQVIGHQWKKESVTGVIAVELILPGRLEEQSARTIEHFISEIEPDDQLIIIYSTAPPLGHDTLALRPNRLAREYAAKGSFVIFMPFGTLQGHAPQQDQRLWQVEGHRLAEVLEMTSLREGNKTVFVCSSYPDVRCATSVDELVARGWMYIYEVRDEMEEFNRVGYSKWFKPQLEAYVAERSTTVVTVSPRLAEKIDIIADGKRSIVVPNGVTDELMERTVRLRTIESWNVEPPRSKVGYIGHLTPSWFDWRNLLRVANARPELEFEIIGHGAPEGLRVPINVSLLGPKTHDECSEIARSWNVGLIPFLPTPLTTAVDPNKLYEYLAMGLKTVSIDMGSVNESPLTWVYERPEALENVLDQALGHTVTADDLLEVEMFLRGRTWSERAEQMYTIFGEAS